MWTKGWLLGLMLQALVALTASQAPPPLQPNREVIAGAEVMWLKPGNPRAVLLIAHAADRQIIDFFPSSPGCPECVGYPEEVNITRTAYDQGFIVILVQSANVTWAGQVGYNPEDPSDVNRVIAVMGILQVRLGWGGKPVYGFGICSGFNFLSVVALEYPFKALSGQIATLATDEDICSWSYKCDLLCGDAPDPARLPKSGVILEKLENYPAVIMVYMVRDKWTADRVLAWRDHLKSMGVKVKIVEIHSTKIDAQVFRRKLPKLSAAAADDLMSRLVKHDMVDSEGVTTMHKTHIASSCENHFAKGWSLGLYSEPEPVPEEMKVYTKEGVGIHQIVQVLKGAHACHEAISSTTMTTFAWFNEIFPIPS